MAPLDIKFSRDGEEAFITFHGSWNRDAPAGYKLSYVEFSSEKGEPVAERDSLDSVRDVLTPPDVSVCNQRGKCFRPVGLALDESGERLFVSSDSTGEIWVVMRDGADGGDGGEGGGSTTTGSGNGSPTGTGAPESSTSTAAAMPGSAYRGVSGQAWAVVAVTAVMVALGGLGFAA
jgi:hypothetical protein